LLPHQDSTAETDAGETLKVEPLEMCVFKSSQKFNSRSKISNKNALAVLSWSNLSSNAFVVPCQTLQVQKSENMVRPGLWELRLQKPVRVKKGELVKLV
jgi:hypothetical protein